MIFEQLDAYHIYTVFHGLNKRINQIIKDLRLPMSTDATCVPLHRTNIYYNYILPNVCQQLVSLVLSEDLLKDFKLNWNQYALSQLPQFRYLYIKHLQDNSQIFTDIIPKAELRYLTSLKLDSLYISFEFLSELLTFTINLRRLTIIGAINLHIWPYLNNEKWKHLMAVSLQKLKHFYLKLYTWEVDAVLQSSIADKAVLKELWTKTEVQKCR
ncbi:unnamed protein product [Didymodactylos carnosus]|uniref:Uncharacterized protein n=1 Tax=Didymodactylos carnosus TaxID=1234261 RepID=A0A815G306_9BILA|nr:unnamed protein product [Didymodactylos carnosus]CAF1333340.1 unnamed protein product [Didymodactylos carnosus]CAF3759492.1 unnamed protein product [Didymodactylos carnosus]CAF4188988.1 unnamed protein product [Didymodactylos carnosus]